jgi:hypothetical protein
MQDQLVGWRKDRKTIFESFGAAQASKLKKEKLRKVK